jgi:hypothetical protein
MTLQLNLDTRRDSFGLTVDLNEAETLIPLVVFDAPDELRQPARLSLVSLEARASHRAAGWASGGGLSEEIMLEPRSQATLAVSRDWLAERVALLRAQGATEALVELPFSTILHLPRAPKASIRRVGRISVTAGASRPAAGLLPATIDLDALSPSGADRIAGLMIEIPTDIVLEADPTLIIETSCAGLPSGGLSLEAEGDLQPGVVIRRIATDQPHAARHRVILERPDELAGQRLSLALTLGRETLLGEIDRLLAESRGRAPMLRASARIVGWGEGADGAERRFLLTPPAVQTAIESRGEEPVLVALGGQTHAARLDGEGEAVAGPALAVEADPEAPIEAARHGGLRLAVLRWPLGRAEGIEIAAEALIEGAVVREPVLSLRPGIAREQGLSREAQALLPLRATMERLSAIVRTGRSPRAGEASVTVTLASGGRRLLAVSMPIEVKRAVKRLPVCIDLGASAISVWAGPPRAAHESFDLRPLPIGSWLAANVDPTHEEAGTLDGEAALLIPSHVSLDPANNLRSDHAPHSLRSAEQIGPGRQAAAARMAQLGRRYDVSVPAPPPVMRSRAATRRITALKHALATGQPTIGLGEPVNRYDAATGKVSAVTAVEVAPLVADVLDELMDLYVMRLGQAESGGETADPPPVAPRVVVTCPSGIDGEVQARYAAALGLFARRLDRLFPGASAFADAAMPLPEAIAAARYAAQMLASELIGAAGEPVFLLTLDLGASSSDVAVARVGVQAGRLQGFEPVATFGLPAGGDAIDRAIIAIVAPLVDRLLAEGAHGWTAAFDAADLGRALASDEASCIGAQQWLRSALRQGKAVLGEAVLRHCGEGPYAWVREDGPTLDLLLAETDRDGHWRGLCLPSGETSGEIVLGPHARAVLTPGEAGGRRLLLRLGRPALEEAGEASAHLAAIVAALGVHLQRMGRAAVPVGGRRPRIVVVPTGRAALWPPLFEALAGEAERGRDGFPLARPMTPAMMKKAVVAGAALLSNQSAGAAPAVEARCPLGIAVAGTHLAEGPGGVLRTGTVAERVLYLSFDLAGRDRTFAAEDGEAESLAARADLGRRFQFVRAAPGLDPKGQMLADLRPALGHLDPVLPLEGDAVLDAQAERIDRFGICEVESRTTGAEARRVTITARDRDWQAVFSIEGNRVSRLR